MCLIMWQAYFITPCFGRTRKMSPSLWKPSSCYLASAGDTFIQSLRLSCRMPYSSFLFAVFVL